MASPCRFSEPTTRPWRTVSWSRSVCTEVFRRAAPVSSPLPHSTPKAMSTINLEEPITLGGIQAINFFNGRLLSGEDLTQEQAMGLLRDRRLGQATGAGIVCGLEARSKT